MITLDSFIHRRTVVLSQDTPARVAATAMRENGIGCVLVVDHSAQLAGIVTDRDFACRWATEPSPSPDLPLSRIMTPEIVKADEGASLQEVIGLMENHGVRRIPIVALSSRGQDRVLGIVTLDDLIASGSIAPSHLAQVVRRQIGRRLGLPARSGRSPRSAQRSEAHLHQTLDRFYAFLTQATGLSPDLTPQVVQFLLGCLVMRISVTAATNFIAQLPRLLQDSLLGLPAGPDRNITPQYIVGELVSRYRLGEEFARGVLVHFLAGLEYLVDPGQLRNLRAQLPLDLQELFPVAPSPVVHAGARAPGLSIGAMSLTSPAFAEGGEIPPRFTGEGVDRSPALAWSGVPPETRQFALICEDLDPTFETSWVHWLAYGISSTVTSLPEGLPAAAELDAPVRLRQGRNSWGNLGYQGPMPPLGHPAHRYVWRLYAIGRELPLAGGASRAQLAAEIRGQVLAEATLTGFYRSGAARRTA
jgi:Raf kinase inhibitor-like YbhB/YbcL family protein